MTVLVTGAAGFIGMHVSRVLLERGETVLGVDNLNDYYDPTLKHARLVQLKAYENFNFERVDICDKDALFNALNKDANLNRIVHLAAQAGVRYSLEDPYAYVQTNILGQLNILEFARHKDRFEHLVYASSSSVYGGNKKLPFSTDDRVDHPVSIYAATKKADELMGHSYAHLYGIPMTGLRFFTVYGPWGRPDMSIYIFSEKMMKGDPIPVFNHGEMQRDFTYIDDIVAGIIGALDNPPPEEEGNAPHRVYNIGNNNPEALMDMIKALEKALGVEAVIDFQPMQPGDVQATYADIDATKRDLGFEPKTSLDQGLENWATWYRAWRGQNA